MEQLLHRITVEYQKLKDNKVQQEVQLPSINKNVNISGINMFIAVLFAANRQLKGQYTTINHIREKDLDIESNSPTITFLDYYISSEVLFLKNDIYNFLPHFSNTVDDIKELKELFIKGEIASFGIKQEQFIEEIFGETIRVPLGENILNYRKLEAVPNEYIIGKKFNYNKSLSIEEIKEKEFIENKVYNNFQEAQQQLFYLLYAYEKANIDILKPFPLEQLGDLSELLINSNNNAIIARNTLNKHNSIKEKTVNIKI